MTERGITMKVLIVGGGQVGSFLASLLLKEGHQVKLVENREKQLAALHSELPDGVVIKGEFTDPIVLENAGIQKVDVVVALTPTDEGNLVVANLARFEFGVKRVIARANNPKNSWLFTSEMGVDVGLTEADLMAHVVAEEMSLGDMMTLLKLNKGKFSLVTEKVHSASASIGKMLCELPIPEDCVIVAIIRREEMILPKDEIVLQPGDEILAIAAVEQAGTLSALLRPGL